MCEIVRAAVESARPTAETKNLVLTVEAPPYVRIMVDPQRFAQVVDNLVSNAVKYTPSGGAVSVSLEAYDDHIELSVADTGIGIDPAERDRLFTRFFRTRDAEERSIQGVGLGLSIRRRSSRPMAVASRSRAATMAARSGSGYHSTWSCRRATSRPRKTSRCSPRSSGSRRADQDGLIKTADQQPAGPVPRPSARERVRPHDELRHPGQVPKISSVWLTSAKPCSAAIVRVQRSTAGPSTSTVRPQLRHTRWWWWESEHRR